jgi:hypothetical protein
MLIIPDGTSVELDELTAGYNKGHLVTVEVEHHHIHDGTHFEAQDYDDEIDEGAPKYWYILAPDTGTRCHLRYEVNNSGPGLLEFFIDPTISDAGVAIAKMNSDHNRATTGELLMYRDPTVSDDGTRLCPTFIGSTATASPVGGSGGLTARSDEAILKQGAGYLIKLSTTVDNVHTSLCLRWYEVGAKTDDGT